MSSFISKSRMQGSPLRNDIYAKPTFHVNTLAKITVKEIESKTHQQLLKTRKSNMSMTSFVAKSLTEVEQQRSITRVRLHVV